MPEPSAKNMTQLFTELVGRAVTFSPPASAAPSPAKQIYAVYQIKPMDSIRVIHADAMLLASMAGALIGLPYEGVKERMADARVDEGLADALREVMNIASRLVSIEHRAVFKAIYEDARMLPAEALGVLRDPCYASHFEVRVDGYQGGRFSLLAPY
ncbi:MAG: hypothetical protein ACLGQX_01950 [Acidobacteriota bacterium]|jgi:hypothetical protein